MFCVRFLLIRKIFYLLTDFSKGFGGKYGVQKDHQDKVWYLLCSPIYILIGVLQSLSNLHFQNVFGNIEDAYLLDSSNKTLHEKKFMYLWGSSPELDPLSLMRCEDQQSSGKRL